jgi:hypothetical protein
MPDKEYIIFRQEKRAPPNLYESLTHDVRLRLEQSHSNYRL